MPLYQIFFSGHEEIYETKLFTFPVQVFLFSDENQEISTFSRLFLFTYLVTLIWIELNFKASARKSAKLSSKLTPKFNLQHPEKWKWKLIEFVWLQLKIIAPGSSIHRLFQHAWTHKLLTGRQWQIFVWTRKTWQTVDAYKLTGFAHNSSFSFNIQHRISAWCRPSSNRTMWEFQLCNQIYSRFSSIKLLKVSLNFKIQISPHCTQTYDIQWERQIFEKS